MPELTDPAARFDPNFATAIPFSRLCRAGRCGECARVRRRCGCFCHPPGHVPIDEGDVMPTPPESIPCPVCGAKFTDPDLLHSHAQRTHPTEVALDQDVPATVTPISKNAPPSFQCPTCAKHYKKKGYLDRHIATAHAPKRRKVRLSDREQTDLGKVLEGAITSVATSRRGEVGQDEVVEEGEGYALLVEVGPGVSVTLRCDGPMAFSLACTAAEQYGIPFTTTQP